MASYQATDVSMGLHYRSFTLSNKQDKTKKQLNKQNTQKIIQQKPDNGKTFPDVQLSPNMSHLNSDRMQQSALLSKRVTINDPILERAPNTDSRQNNKLGGSLFNPLYSSYKDKQIKKLKAFQIQNKPKPLTKKYKFTETDIFQFCGTNHNLKKVYDAVCNQLNANIEAGQSMDLPSVGKFCSLNDKIVFVPHVEFLENGKFKFYENEANLSPKKEGAPKNATKLNMVEIAAEVKCRQIEAVQIWKEIVEKFTAICRLGKECNLDLKIGQLRFISGGEIIFEPREIEGIQQIEKPQNSTRNAWKTKNKDEVEQKPVKSSPQKYRLTKKRLDDEMKSNGALIMQLYQNQEADTKLLPNKGGQEKQIASPRFPDALSKFSVSKADPVRKSRFSQSAMSNYGILENSTEASPVRFKKKSDMMSQISKKSQKAYVSLQNRTQSRLEGELMEQNANVMKQLASNEYLPSHTLRDVLRKPSGNGIFDNPNSFKTFDRPHDTVPSQNIFNNTQLQTQHDPKSNQNLNQSNLVQISKQLTSEFKPAVTLTPILNKTSLAGSTGGYENSTATKNTYQTLNSLSGKGSQLTSYPQGEYKQDDLRQKFQESSPFYLRQHMHKRHRETDPSLYLSAMQDARKRFENNLKAVKHDKLKQVSQLSKNIDTSKKLNIMKQIQRREKETENQRYLQRQIQIEQDRKQTDHQQRFSSGGKLFMGPEESPHRVTQALEKKFHQQNFMSNELTSQMNDRLNQRSIYRSAKLTSEQINVEKANTQIHHQRLKLQDQHKQQMDMVKEEWAKQKLDIEHKRKIELADQRFTLQS